MIVFLYFFSISTSIFKKRHLIEYNTSQLIGRNLNELERKWEMLEEYEINDQTLAILPVDKDTSQVIETKRRFYVSKTPRMIISDSCEYYGSTLDGRMHGAKVLTGIQYKTPIVVEESSPMIFFPTESPRKDLCTWINLKHVKDYYESGKKTVVLFENNKKIKVKLSKTSFQNQVYRAARLSQRLNDRKIVKK